MSYSPHFCEIRSDRDLPARFLINPPFHPRSSEPELKGLLCHRTFVARTRSGPSSIEPTRRKRRTTGRRKHESISSSNPPYVGTRLSSLSRLGLTRSCKQSLAGIRHRHYLSVSVAAPVL